MTEREFYLLIENTKGIVFSAVRRYLPAEMYHSIGDVAQETYLRVYKSIKKMKFMDERARNNWIYTIAKNESLRIKNRNTRESDKIIKFINFSDQKTDLIDLMEEEIELLRSVISLLPEKYRMIFELLVVGFSEKEVAEKLLIKHGTVKSRIHRGKELIHRRITTKGEEWYAGRHQKAF